VLRERDMSSLSLVFGLFFIVIPILVIIGLYIFAHVNQERISQEMTGSGNDWRAVSARITAASVEEAVRSCVEDEMSYYPSIQFEYTHGDRVYKGTGAVGRPYNAISRAWETLSRYEVGKEITVYCNPDNPREARLWVK
jgi:hypothetical protein